MPRLQASAVSELPRLAPYGSSPIIILPMQEQVQRSRSNPDRRTKKNGVQTYADYRSRDKKRPPEYKKKAQMGREKWPSAQRNVVK